MSKSLKRSIAVALSICLVLLMSLAMMTSAYAEDLDQSLPVKIVADSETVAPGETVNINLSLSEAASLYMLEGTFSSEDESLTLGTVASTKLADYGAADPAKVVYYKLDSLLTGGIDFSADEAIVSIPVTVASDAEDGTYTVNFNLVSGGLTVPLDTPMGVIAYDGVAYTKAATLSATFEVAQEPEGFNVTVNNIAGATVSLTDGLYSGTQNFTVSAETPCVAAYTTDGGQTYTKLASSSTTTGVYSVNVTSDMQIAVVLKGDANLSGIINSSDVAIAKRPSLNASFTMSPLAILVADMNDNGVINSTDAAMIQRITLQKTATINW